MNLLRKWYGRRLEQMDDYGIDKRHYGRHGDCTISPTYDNEDTHHCGDDVNDEDNLTS